MSDAFAYRPPYSDHQAHAQPHQEATHGASHGGTFVARPDAHADEPRRLRGRQNLVKTELKFPFPINFTGVATTT